MRHIWICMIDGCLIRSGPIQPGDTMPLLMERLLHVFPHMAPEWLKVICEDGRVFDSELWFSNPTANTAESQNTDNVLAAVGVVEGHIGVKIHRGMTPEEVLQLEAHTFSGKINDSMDFGIYDFSGEMLASIEDMIHIVGPEKAQVPSSSSSSHQKSHRKLPKRPLRFRKKPTSSRSPKSASDSAPI